MKYDRFSKMLNNRKKSGYRIENKDERKTKNRIAFVNIKKSFDRNVSCMERKRARHDFNIQCSEQIFFTIFKWKHFSVFTTSKWKKTLFADSTVIQF